MSTYRINLQILFLRSGDFLEHLGGFKNLHHYLQELRCMHACVCVGLYMCVNESESLGVTVFLEVSEDALRIFHGLTDELFSSSLCLRTVQRKQKSAPEGVFARAPNSLRPPLHERLHFQSCRCIQCTPHVTIFNLL